MKKLLSILALVLMFGAPTFGDDPKPVPVPTPPPAATYVLPTVTIEGAAEIVPYGEMIQLSAKADKVPDNVASVNYDWKIFDTNQPKKRVYVSENGRTVLLAAGIKPAELLATVDVAYTFVNKDASGKITEVKTLTTGILTALIKVGTDPIVPTPGPNPPVPPPTPPAPKPIPDAPLGLVQVTLDTFGSMKSPTKAAVAKSLADNYKVIKNKIAAKEITILKDAYTQLSALNGATLTTTQGDGAEWNLWDQAMKQKVYKLYLDKKLAAIEDYIGVFAEIADSLSYVSEQK